MRNKGFSLIELILVVGITVVIVTASALALNKTRASYELKGAAAQITASLRYAQLNAVNNVSSTPWGVRFDNTTPTAPSVTVFASSSYDATKIVNSYYLGKRVQYDAAYINTGRTKTIAFARGTGYTTSTAFAITTTVGTSSYLISISSAGVVSVAFEFLGNLFAYNPALYFI